MSLAANLISTDKLFHPRDWCYDFGMQTLRSARHEGFREKVAQLLARGTDLKLQIGNSERARAFLAEAYQIASSESVTPPWPQIAAYRYAHVLLRNEHLRLNDLREADALFSEAARLRTLGPLPHLYRLAVLHRMTRHGGQKIPERLLKTVYEACIREVSESSVFSSAADPDQRHLQRQHGWVNMLEFASYATGLPYKPLEGLASDSDFAVGEEGGWILAGSVPALANVVYGKALALEELDYRGQSCHGAVLFCIEDERQTTWVKIAGHTGSQRNLRNSTALLLFDALRQRQTGASLHLSSATLRQYRLRARQDLADLTGRPAADFGDGGLSLPDDLTVFGATAVHNLERALNR